MNKATSILIFSMGAFIGSFVTWRFIKNKYEKIAQEEIDSVKDRFKTTVNNYYVGPETSDDEKKIKEKDIASYSRTLSSEGYTDYSASNSNSETTQIVEEIPFVISPEEFGELEDEGYDKLSFTFYADHVLADDNDQIVEDVDGTVGFDSLTHFGEYEDDSVFVRNNRLKIDYEILYSQRTYSEVLEKKPYLLRGIE